jgi:hypothetical protein
MSSNLRGTLTLWFDRLVLHATVVRGIVDAAAAGNPPSAEQLVELRRQRRFIADLLTKIQARQDVWEELIDRLEGDERAAEQQRYDSYTIQGMHFVRYVDAVDELRTHIDVLLDEVGTVTSSSRRSSVSQITTASARAPGGVQAGVTLTSSSHSHRASSPTLSSPN